jgi:DNA-directed RNA polymerase specialized sigma24 family protein
MTRGIGADYFAMTEQEIADRLGISRKNVDMTIRRALRKIRRRRGIHQFRELVHLARRERDNGGTL